MPGTVYHAYCDESCTDAGHSHMALSGILTTAEAAARYREHMAVWRVQANMMSELKWQKVTNDKSREYQEYVATGMGHIQAKAFAFRSLIIQKSELDYRRFHDGDRE